MRRKIRIIERKKRMEFIHHQNKCQKKYLCLQEKTTFIFFFLLDISCEKRFFFCNNISPQKKTFENIFENEAIKTKRTSVEILNCSTFSLVKLICLLYSVCPPLLSSPLPPSLFLSSSSSSSSSPFARPSPQNSSNSSLFYSFFLYLSPISLTVFLPF